MGCCCPGKADGGGGGGAVEMQAAEATICKIGKQGPKVEVAGAAASMKTALENCRGVDAILIDTPGRSQNDADSLAGRDQVR